MLAIPNFLPCACVHGRLGVIEEECKGWGYLHRRIIGAVSQMLTALALVDCKLFTLAVT